MGSYVGVCVSRSSAAPQSVSPSFCKRTRIWGLRSSKHEHLLDLFVNISSVEDRMCMLCLGNNERFIYVVLKELSDILFDMESTRLSGSHGLGCGRQFRGVAQGALLWPEAERFQASQSTPSGSFVAFAGNYHNYAFFSYLRLSVLFISVLAVTKSVSLRFNFWHLFCGHFIFLHFVQIFFCNI